MLFRVVGGTGFLSSPGLTSPITVRLGLNSGVEENPFLQRAWWGGGAGRGCSRQRVCDADAVVERERKI